MTDVLDSLLSDLRARGVVLESAGDRLHVEAPAGTLTEQDRAVLTAAKPALLERLNAEAEIRNMSLEHFKRDGCPIEVWVPWLPETLWWVPEVEHVADLMRQHISRGRVYTARELTNLTNLTTSDKGGADLQCIARLKAKLDGEILRVGAHTDVVTARAASDSPKRCRACHESRFWLSVHGVTVCARCHPPASPRLVASWSDDGAEAS